MCLTCGCMDAHKEMGEANITYEDVKRAADENGSSVADTLEIMSRDRGQGPRPTSRRSMASRSRRAPNVQPHHAGCRFGLEPSRHPSFVASDGRSVAPDPEQPAVGEHAVGDEHLAVLGHLDAARLRELAARELALLLALDLEQDRGREVAGREALLEGEPAVLGDLVDVERAVVRVEGDVEDRREAATSRPSSRGPVTSTEHTRAHGVGVDAPDVRRARLAGEADELADVRPAVRADGDGRRDGLGG